ncbi:hypothetical protein Poli38472_013770 [Pythium oligandrum]|uniref:CCDC93 coiled-coil domain-containing protein n=1 Tax=Pythium oligandrum TaxID=41045 RepID=A0A8K1FJ09_PYTOL|nr:hypothetical protein Poli38472_013770 [Pythium oligandrum]|eukprot:TMW61307.1 hypothetical protein Poli38472_013770 [Pythium oligandrum]
MFGSTATSALYGAPSGLHASTHSISDAALEDAAFAADVGEDYGEEATHKLTAILRLLDSAGYIKARVRDYSAFERILGGIVWLLQRIVKREDAARGRVQWELLFQAHVKMKPRLGLAQEIIHRVKSLPYACPIPIQPHQLLLQDFGDIGAVQRLVSWLIEQNEDVAHLASIQDKRRYLAVGTVGQPEPPLKREVQYLQSAYAAQRRWQFVSTDWQNEPEDAMIQRCLLEYGERVAVVEFDVDTSASSESSTLDGETSGTKDLRHDLMAQLAVSAAMLAKRDPSGKKITMQRKKTYRAAAAKEFEAQYQRMLQQAVVEQEALLAKQRERETVLLQQAVLVPSSADTDSGNTTKHDADSELSIQRVDFLKHEDAYKDLQENHQALKDQRKQEEAHLVAIQDAMRDLDYEMKQIQAEETQRQEDPIVLATLRELVVKNETLKQQKSAFKVQCKTDLETLQRRLKQLRVSSAASDVKDPEVSRLLEIEQMHAHVSAKHTQLKSALAHTTREVHRRRKDIDDVPTRIELLQYEKRFQELYDEVALTLDETRKYYCVYNTLKATHEFLEKEISLLNSIHDNFDVAMGSKAATTAFFTQIDAIIRNVETSVTKQQVLRQEHHARVETLDSKYQLLLEQERLYVNAIREFQKECEKHERLNTRIQQRTQLQLQQRTVQPIVAPDDVVI